MRFRCSNSAFEW